MRCDGSLPAFPSYLHVVVLLEELHAPLHNRGQVQVHDLVCRPVTCSEHLEVQERKAQVSEKKGREGG